MAILPSPSPSFPLLSPPKPSFFSVKTLIPKVEFSEPLRFPKCSTKIQHSTPLRSLRCSSSSSPSIDDEKPPSSRIFVKGLSRSISEGYLMKIFSCFGDITNVKLIRSKPSKESIGMGYVWFAREEDALLAVKEMDGKFVDGRFIAVVMALPESPSKQVRTVPYQF